MAETIIEHIPTPKEQFKALVIDLFDKISNLNIPEGDYLTLSNLCRDINAFNSQIGNIIETIIHIQPQIVENRYYRTYRQEFNFRDAKLTEAFKAQSDKYRLCECGRYIHKNSKFATKHLKTAIHRTGILNRQYSAKRNSTDINDLINRYVLLEGFTLKHIETIDIDNRRNRRNRRNRQSNNNI